MKRIFAFSLIVLFIIIFGFAGFYFLCKVEVKCKNCDQTSKSVEESKQNGFYLKEYNVDKSSFNLKYNDENVKIQKVWCEKAWHYNTENCFSTNYNNPVLSKNSYNIIIEFTKSTDHFLFNFQPMINDIVDNQNGGIEQNRKTLRYEDLPKQFKLIVKEKNPEMNVGWQQAIVSDTLNLNLQNEL